ncbi:MAG: 4-alpha-glucanotransferase, partial [Kiritimatiellae bacterium]|nr:4-alpha-glucanotransferase [Kiritimatiellia bacterium]
MGDIGPSAYAFVDQLVAMGQRLWQILPHGLTGYGDSPYQSFSTFAGNPMLLSPDKLVEDGLLKPGQLAKYPTFPTAFVDYGPVIDAKEVLFDKVCRNFDAAASEQMKGDFEIFCAKNADWLEEFSLFMALKKAHDLEPWPTWE